MKKLMFVTMETGYCGSTGHDVFDATDMTDEEIEQEVYEMACNHASMYGYYPIPLDSDADFDPDDEDNDGYVDSIEGYAVPYVPEEHDMLRAGGGSFLDEYK